MSVKLKLHISFSDNLVYRNNERDVTSIERMEILKKVYINIY